MVKIIRQTRVMEPETIQKNEAKLKGYRSCGKFLLFGVFLLVFCGFANKAAAWTGTGTAVDPWLIGDGQTNTASAVKATISGNTLTISGAGNMADFWNSTEGEAPWNYHYYNNSSSITNVVIQNSVTNIGNRAFHDLNNLQTITIPNSVTIIGRESFFMEHVTNTNFQSVTIPNSVMEIEGEAFKGCSNLKTVTIENGTTGLNFSLFDYRGNEYSWGPKTDWFYGCPLQTLHLGRTLSSSSYNRPFSGTSIQTLTIGNGVTFIPESAFENCSNLITVTIADGQNDLDFNIGSFYGCPIQTLNLGRNILSSTYAFSGNTSLKTINITGNNVTSIPTLSFSGCTGLNSITIPNTINEIGSNAFVNCTNLKTVTIEDGTNLLLLGSYPVFGGCPIQTLYLGRNMDYNNSAISGPFSGIISLSSLIIGNNVTSIGAYCFNGCSGLTQIISNPTTPPTIQYNTFNGVNKAIPIYINCNYQAAYKSAQYWSDFTNYNCDGVTTDDGVTINGLTWATRNVDKPGTFAKNPEDAGMFYQWNRNVGWSATDPLVNSNGGITWDSSMPAGTTWAEENNPCPEGWRLPTLPEVQGLMGKGQWTTVNGVNGRKFTDPSNGNSIFLPAAGTRYSDGGFQEANMGYYRTSTLQGVNPAAYFVFDSGNDGWQESHESRDGMCIRCVKKDLGAGINYIESLELKVYPNPAQDELFIKSDSPIKKVEIYSLAGALMLSENNFNGKISISTLPKGIYLVKVYTDTGLMVSNIVKE